MSFFLRGISLFFFFSLLGVAPVWGLDFPAQGVGAREFQQKWKTATDLFAAGEIGHFQAGGFKLVYRVFSHPSHRRNVVVFPGFGESPSKYIELIHQFYARGYNVFILSHRGMGESQRLLKNPQIIHIEDTAVYSHDAGYFLQAIVKPRLGGDPVYLYAHSTGGLIAAHVLAENPDYFAKAVLNAPLFELNTKGYAHWLIHLMTSVYSPTSYAPGYSDWDPHKATFAGQTATGSIMRWWVSNQIYRQNPALSSGGPSVAWLKAVLRATTPQAIRAVAKKITTPVLLFQAGDDTYVLPQGHKIFVDHCPGAKLQLFPTARHEIHNERDFIRERAFQLLWDFFEN